MPTVDIPLKLDLTEFNVAFAEYLKVSSRDLATAINTKLFYIALRALAETHAVEAASIRSDLNQIITAVRHTGRQAGSTGKIPRGLALAQRLRTLQGAYLQIQHGWEAEKLARFASPSARRLLRRENAARNMTTAKRVQKLTGRRVRSRAFLKSGWLPAIKTLAPLAEKKGAPYTGPRPVQYGQPKGLAIPAKPPASPSDPVAGLIENSIGKLGKRALKLSAAMQKFARPALQRAVDAETRSMVDYLATKFIESARKIGIQTRS